MQVFHKMHLFGFFGFVFFGMTHYAGMWVAFVPGQLSSTVASELEILHTYVCLRCMRSQICSLAHAI